MSLALALFGSLAASNMALAVEGGTGAYLLGSRDLMAGFVPPPGSYVSIDGIYINGSAPALSIGGQIVTEPEIDAFVFKLNGTQVFDGSVMGGRFALTLNLPVARAKLDAQAEVALLQNTFNVTDEQSGLADITVTPSLGWSSGPPHPEGTRLLALRPAQLSHHGAVRRYPCAYGLVGRCRRRRNQASAARCLSLRAR
jgi:hypothetical protein